MPLAVDRLYGCPSNYVPVAMTGGVAMNPAVVKLMGDRLGLSILLPPEPQITGALGAALMARRYFAGNSPRGT